MSHFQVAFTKILAINPHPNTGVTSLEIATVYGFQVIVRKNTYNVGDFALYIPVDSVLPQALEDLILGPNPKIKLDRHRVKQIRIQRFPSQGMLVDVSIVKQYFLQAHVGIVSVDFKLEVDYSKALGVTKYEPPVPEFQKVGTPGKKRDKPLTNSNFHQYNGLENVKWFPDLFKEGELVVIQEKLHGSNCRAGIVPTQANTILKKIKKFFGLLPKFEYVYGSNAVELTNRQGKPGYYGSDVYGAVLDKVGAKSKMLKGEQIYGELIGPGIQKGYDYGLKEHHFVLFDVKFINPFTKEWEWMEPELVVAYAKNRGFDVVPTLYNGPFNKNAAYELTKGDSVYCPSQKIREGIVIKSIMDYNNKGVASNRKSLKYISETYLDKDNSDFH